MRPLNRLGLLSAAIAGVGMVSAPAMAVEGSRIDALDESRLEAVEDDTNYGSAGALEPVYIDGDVVNVEIFGRPDPETQIEVINDSIDEGYEDLGVELIEIAVPVES
ncbi:MAG: hypothetical protein F6J97_04005 [Leptolyngbya sp. SIO4C1]|nr:hypothetical protein [Leptolyngbya sp. SIO4C1]